MRTVGVLLIWISVGVAQTAQDAPLLTGTVLECDARATGELSIRAADNVVLRYQFDHKTYAERDHQMIEAGRLKPGEKVEVLSDREPAYALRYARTIHVIQPAPPRPLTMGRYRAYNTYNAAAELAMPTGNVTYSGVVSSLDSERVVLRTREGGNLSILLRKDTRFLEDGQLVQVEQLRPNMRVFVRAGKDIYQQVEAYQVIWGTILTPH